MPRRANVGADRLRIVFPDHPAWSLRSREVAMALLNPHDPRLLERSIAFGSRSFAIGHVRGRCDAYRVCAAWQQDNDRPDDIALWAAGDWDALVRSQIAKGSRRGTVRNLICAIRDLVVLAPILTGGGIESDPWAGRTPTQIAKNAKTGATQVISPTQWIPLMTACWAYINTFADDILSLRDTHRCDVHLHTSDRSVAGRTVVNYEELFQKYLSLPDAVIPVRNHPNSPPKPNWVQLSRLITADLTSRLFETGSAAGRARRTRVYEAIAEKRVTLTAVKSREYDDLLAQRVAAGVLAPDIDPRRTGRLCDELLDDWIDDEANRVPVWDRTITGVPGDITEADINWDAVERLVWGAREPNNLTESTRRRDRIVQVARSGRTFAVRRGYGGHQRACVEFVEVGSPDGQRRPWRTAMSDLEARAELRALRAACYIYITAMTMMRDSEVQDLQRGCVQTFHGVAAVKSHSYKGRASKTVAHWWIVDGVATAISVLERLSTHPEYLFARFVDGEREDAEPGIRAGHEIDFFVNHIAATGFHSEIAPIPAGPSIGPRALRRTTACISRELGGTEIALSHQLKHAISYGYNNVTSRYMAPDPEWAELLNTNRSAENLEHMVNVLQESVRSAHPLAGRGGERLTQAMVDASGGASGGPKAMLLADQEVLALLKKIAPEIHFGPANACVFAEETALCRTQAATDVPGPLLGLCQPARCPNSVIGVEHLPVWISELKMLEKTIADHRLSAPRRAALSNRLSDVKHVLGQAKSDVSGGAE